MEQYHQLLKEILGRGEVQFEPRTEEYILGIPSSMSVYDLREHFPLMTTKNVPPRLPFEELFWKLRGERNVKSLVDKNIHIWTANAFDRYLKVNRLKDKFPKHSQEWNEEFEKYKEKIANDFEFAENAGDLGPVYGYQWRHWKYGNDLAELVKRVKSVSGIDIFEKIPELEMMKHLFVKDEVDQLKKLLSGIKEKPGSRYHILSAWNVGDLPDMALGPCPFWHQFTVYGNNLDLTMVQRSCDVFLGVPFNIAQDSLLAHMVANETNLQPRRFNHHYMNTHAYLGVPPRADFWIDGKNAEEFQKRFNGVGNKEQYLDLREWYLKNTSPESPGNERKDHIPFILEQLSKQPKDLPLIEIKKNVSLLEAIQTPALEYVKVSGYNPDKWDARAEMAA